jgi:hypothetical protein
MAIIASTGKFRNKIESLWRVADNCWFGRDTSTFEQVPDILNGEYLLAVNAAGTGTVNIIGVNANNQVVSGNGTVLPTAEHFSSNFQAATAVSQSIYIAATTLQLAGVQIVFGTASASGTFTLEHLTGTQAPGSGTVMLTGTLSTAGTANTVLTGTLVATLATLQLAAGDRIGAVFAGTETGLVGLNVTVTLTRY